MAESNIRATTHHHSLAKIMKIEAGNITTSSWHSASCDKFRGMFDFNYLSALDISSVFSPRKRGSAGNSALANRLESKPSS
jgi:hypothetical protein